MSTQEHAAATTDTRKGWPRSPMLFFLGIIVIVGLLIATAVPGVRSRLFGSSAPAPVENGVGVDEAGDEPIGE